MILPATFHAGLLRLAPVPTVRSKSSLALTEDFRLRGDLAHALYWGLKYALSKEEG